MSQKYTVSTWEEAQELIYDLALRRHRVPVLWEGPDEFACVRTPHMAATEVDYGYVVNYRPESGEKGSKYVVMVKERSNDDGNANSPAPF